MPLGLEHYSFTFILSRLDKRFFSEIQLDTCVFDIDISISLAFSDKHLSVMCFRV